MITMLKKLIGPIRYMTEEFEDKVASGMKYLSHAGHPVQSIGELRIANHLYDNGIPYIYDTPMRVGKDILRPDFVLPDSGMIIEFKGMDTEEYNKKFERKLNIYAKSGHEVLIVHPQGLEQVKKLLSR